MKVFLFRTPDRKGRNQSPAEDPNPTNVSTRPTNQSPSNQTSRVLQGLRLSLHAGGGRGPQGVHRPRQARRGARVEAPSGSMKGTL